MNTKSEGIYCRSTNKFYYLETGRVRVVSAIDRLRSILVHRGHISFFKKDPTDKTVPYNVMTMDEAKRQNIEIEIIYLNKHIESSVKNEKKDENDSWLS